MVMATALRQSAPHADICLLVLRIVEALVDDPEGVEMHSEELDGCTCIRIGVEAEDVGKLIGRSGRTARSIRTILSAASVKVGHRYTLDIVQEK